MGTCYTCHTTVDPQTTVTINTKKLPTDVVEEKGTITPVTFIENEQDESEDKTNIESAIRHVRFEDKTQPIIPPLPPSSPRSQPRPPPKLTKSPPTHVKVLTTIRSPSRRSRSKH